MNEENKVYGKVNFDGTTENIGTKYENDCSKFKVCDNANLPVKPSFFTKLKNIYVKEGTTLNTDSGKVLKISYSKK